MAVDALDIDSRLLSKPPRFGGEEERWEDWSFCVRAYLTTLSDSAADWIDQAVASAVAIGNGA